MHQLSVISRIQSRLDVVEVSAEVALSAAIQPGFKLVKAKSNLPAPVAGVITLAADTIYLTNGVIQLGTDRIVASIGSIIAGSFSRKDKWVYDGTGTMFTATSTVLMHNITMELTANGKAFDISGAGICEFNCVRWLGVPGATIGDLEADIALFDGSNCLGFGDGLSLSGANNVFAFRFGAFTQGFGGVGTMIDLGVATFNFFQCIGVQVITAVGGTGISGAVDNGNMADGDAIGELLSSRINGPGTSLVGITPDDIQWLVAQVAGVRDSSHSGSFSMASNSTDTVIGTQSVFVKVAGTTVLGQARRMDDGAAPINNHLRHIGKDPVTYLISVNGMLKKSGASKTFHVQVHKNGSPVGQPIAYSIGTQATNISLMTVVDLDENEFADVRIANIEDDNDALMTELAMICTG